MNKRYKKLSLVIFTAVLMAASPLSWTNSVVAYGAEDAQEHDERQGHDQLEEAHENEDEDSHAHGHGDEEKGDVSGHDDHDHHEGEGRLEIDKDAAESMNIRVEKAGAQDIRVSIPVTGKVGLNRNAIAQVRARFSGIVKSVAKTQSETVEEGETLATVESNESLQVYPVKSPIRGVILERNTNIGHVTGDENLFEVADLSTLWVQFHIFPKDMAAVQEGQPVRVTTIGGANVAETSISSILPVAESESQTVVARGEIHNKDGKWRPNMTIHGEIFVNEKRVPVAVREAAIQRMEGKSVVFIEENGAYEQRVVRIGLQDGEWAEVLEGLKEGESYVSANSFILKAHAGKSEAGHEH